MSRMLEDLKVLAAWVMELDNPVAKSVHLIDIEASVKRLVKIDPQLVGTTDQIVQDVTKAINGDMVAKQRLIDQRNMCIAEREAYNMNVGITHNRIVAKERVEIIQAFIKARDVIEIRPISEYEFAAYLAGIRLVNQHDEYKHLRLDDWVIIRHIATVVPILDKESEVYTGAINGLMNAAHNLGDNHSGCGWGGEDE